METSNADVLPSSSWTGVDGSIPVEPVINNLSSFIRKGYRTILLEVIGVLKPDSGKADSIANSVFVRGWDGTRMN